MKKKKKVIIPKPSSKKKKKKKSSNQALLTEKVYGVSETPTQHTCGVSKTNEKLTNGLKITTHLRLFKIKKHKYSLNFQSSPSKQHFPFF